MWMSLRLYRVVNNWVWLGRGTSLSPPVPSWKGRVEMKPLAVSLTGISKSSNTSVSYFLFWHNQSSKLSRHDQIWQVPRTLAKIHKEKAEGSHFGFSLPISLASYVFGKCLYWKKKVLCPMSNIACLYNMLWSFKKCGQCKGKQTVTFTLASAPFVDKAIPQGPALKQASYNYCKVFPCSSIFIFSLEVLGNDHMEGGQGRWQPEDCVSTAAVNWSGPESRALLLAALRHLWRLKPWLMKPQHFPGYL